MGKMFEAMEKANFGWAPAGQARPVPPVPPRPAPQPLPQQPPMPTQPPPSPRPNPQVPEQTAPAPHLYTPPVVRNKLPEDQDPFLDFLNRSRGRGWSDPPDANDNGNSENENDLSREDKTGPGHPGGDKPAMDSIPPSPQNETDNIHSSLVTVLKPHSIEAEQFRLLKNNILFPEKGDPPRSIMVTSPSPDEGKSFVSTNLAVSIAQSIDEYVMLMDCDLRSPSIHTLFGMENPKGLSDHLSSSIPLHSLLKKTFIDKLTILPGGTIPPNPSELLSSEQMRQLLREVKARYSDRYVIVDTPPPSITSETNAIARIVDGIILVIKCGKTKKKELEDIIDIYGKNKILGVIKNFSKQPPLSSRRYKRYGYIKE